MSDSLRTSILRMVASAFPSLVYGHPRTYVVASVDAEGRLDLEPAPDAPHLPPLKGVEQWAVAMLDPAVGTDVVVGFRDANPARPFVMGARGGAGDSDTNPLTNPVGRVMRWGEIATGPTALSAPLVLVPDPTNSAVGISRVKA